MKYWLSAIGTYGVGDTVTTIIGLSIAGIYEANPAGNIILQNAGFGGIIFAKAIYFLLMVGISHYFFSNEKIAPITITIIGSIICLWNTAMILTAL